MTHEAAEIAELAERVEAAAGPHHELDARANAILRGDRFEDARAVCMGGMWMTGANWGDHGPGIVLQTFRPTASLDAAMELVPEGTGFQIDRYWNKDGERWSCFISTGGLPGNPRQVTEVYDAVSPALAVTAAALRARAILFEQGEQA